MGGRPGRGEGTANPGGGLQIVSPDRRALGFMRINMASVWSRGSRRESMMQRERGVQPAHRASPLLPLAITHVASR